MRKNNKKIHIQSKYKTIVYVDLNFINEYEKLFSMKETNILTTNIHKETLPKLKMIEQKGHCID